jgi:hypothetical protein
VAFLYAALTRSLRNPYAYFPNSHRGLTCEWPRTCAIGISAGESSMFDVIFVAAAIGFFALGALFVRGCEAM